MTSSKEYAARVEELYNAGDLEALVESYAEDAVMHVPELATPLEGRAAIRDLFAEQFAEFPDGKMTAEILVEEGETIAEEFTYTGTNTGAMRLPDGTVLPATGKRIEMRGIELVQFHEGKVVRHDVFHPSGMQLGLIPAAATA